MAWHLRQKLLAERQLISGKRAHVRALRRNIRKGSVRAHQTAVRAVEEEAGVGWANDESMLVRMHSIRRNWVRLAAASRRCRLSCRVPRHVGERRTSIGRAENAAAVCREPVRCIVERAADIYHVRKTRRRDDKIVVPALPRAVVISLASWRLCCRQIDKHRHTSRDVVAAKNVC